MNFIFGPLSLDSANGEGERDRELGCISSCCYGPGEQANVARQSVALLTRPHRTGTMHRLKESAVIPLLREGEVNDDRSVSEWMIWKITKGELRVQTAEEKQVAVTG
ncbi:EF-hand domain family protein [Aspergillus niger]|nr:EF-hand domain family protein [Aspergillus niger]